MKSHSPSSDNIAPATPSSPPASPATGQDLISTQKQFCDKPLPSGSTSTQIATPPSTPPRSPSNLSPVYGKVATSTAWSNLPALRRLLIPKEGKCGALKDDGQPCKARTPKVGREQVDAHIEAITTYSQSSHGLKSELEGLAMHVHCENHNYGDYKASRVEGWTALFPGQGTESEQIEKQVKRVLGKISVRCAWEVLPGEPCPRRIGGQRVQNRTKTITETVKHAVYTDDTRVERFLGVLLANMYCDDHVAGRPIEKVATWKREIMGICKRHNGRLAKNLSIETANGFRSQGQGSHIQNDSSHLLDIGGNLIRNDRGLPSPRTSQVLSPGLAIDPTKFWPAAYDMTPFERIVDLNRCNDDKASHKLVEKEMTRLLSKEDEKCGYVYLYEVEGNTGLVKIGYTSRQLQTRHEEWTFDCNRKTKPLYPIQFRSATIIPHAHRVEALCHAELDYCRIRIYCNACLKRHIEWFEISVEKAIKVIEKWTEWMRTYPYAMRELRSQNKWSLREEERRRSRNIGQFMREISANAEATTI